MHSFLSRLLPNLKTCCATLLTLGIAATPLFAQPARQVELFDFDWKFVNEEVPGAEQTAYNDSSWQLVDLPHDFMISGSFMGKDYPGGQRLGFRPLGVGWYRKSFPTPSGMGGKKMWLNFEGVYRAPKVWVNGKLAAEWLNGYLWRYVDITPLLKPEGETNVVAVRADNSLPDTSRWYTGGGICRHVRQVITGNIHVVQDGTAVTTPSISEKSATVLAKTEVLNESSADVNGVLVSEVCDRSGAVVANARSEIALPVGKPVVAEQTFRVTKPSLWDLEHPTLYRVVSRVEVAGKATDEYATPFGIREVKITPDGLFLNGKRVFVHGFCLHHDHGCLGAAAFDRAIERRLQTMKEMGVNGIRLSHNSYSASLLEMADRMGFLIFDEAFDDWSDEFYTDPARVPDYKVIKKSPSLITDRFDESAPGDLAMFVRRDRNHPSVFIWSVGNEVGWLYRNPDFGIGRYDKLAAVVKSIDPTRPVTAALRTVRLNAAKNEALETCPEPHQMGLRSDVMSANYMEKFFARDRLNHPDLSFISSESFTGQGGRKAYAAMDLEHSVGMFYWGAINYLGESQGYPLKGWKNGFVERTGFIKSAGRDAMTYFMPEKPQVHIAIMDWRPEVSIKWENVSLVQNQMESHWNFEGFTKKLTVETYTNCQEVDLQLNGKSLGIKKREGAPGLGARLTWEIKTFEPGSLLAIGLNGGKEAARHELKTAGPPKSIRLIPDEATLKADGQDLSHIRVEVVDGQGVVSNDAKNLITFSVSGAGTNAGVDNGNPASDELFQANTRSVDRGTALLVVRAKRQPGTISVKATADGLAAASIELRVK